MGVEPGQVLLHYQLIEQIGAGGMGVVYRATDNKLRRDVAIKVLPEELSQNPERLARFEREALLLASLNHPGIASIYGVEEADGVRFLVLELVEGENLDDRLARGALPIHEALDFARQIAEALEEAHENGIVHRDLKPANVRITRDGTLKVLDFGLARAYLDDEESAEKSSTSPTLTAAMTQAGVILGTAAYMSPEQARGKKVTKRTDIWAFGVILYEMLMGKQLFEDATVSDTLASVLRAEPEWERLPADTPPAVRRLLRRCLAKDPRQRLHDIADARIEINEALSGEESVAVAASVPASRGSRLQWVLTLLFALVALLALRFAMNQPEVATEPALHVSITLPQELELQGAATGEPIPAISPNGRHVVFSAREEDTIRLYLRSFDSPEVVPLTGTERGSTPFFSPDGQWVAFFASGMLKKVSIRGGTPIDLCEAPSNRGGSWSADGSIIFAPAYNSGLVRISENGGEREFITAPDPEKRERTHRWPHVLPGGQAVVFTIGTQDKPGNYEDATIAVVDLVSGQIHPVVEGGSIARYSPTGHLLYSRAATLSAIPFDVDRLLVTGPPAQVLEGVAGDRTSGAVHFGISDTGTLLYMPGVRGDSSIRNLAWVDRQGRAETICEVPRIALQGASLSPDARFAALSLGYGPGDGDVWVYDFARRRLTRLTFHSSALGPIWSGDGKRVVYGVTTGGAEGISWKPADGSDVEQLIARDGGEYAVVPEVWVPGTETILYSRSGGKGGFDIMMLDAATDEIRPLIDGPFGEGGAALSPDGKWMAYASDESGRFEIYVRPFPGPGGKWQVSTQGGRGPRWSRESGELFYTDGAKMMVVAVELEPSFSPATPRQLFEFPFARSVGPNPDYDVTPDGQRFIMSERPRNEPIPRELHLITHFAVER
ncbi:MAG: serine/threonine-protein kinase [Candidatus Latescibacterota bacterium]|nr:MAG: serine/threonine-protein kinase [Candidatus Latescibacterota bacterium]